MWFAMRLVVSTQLPPVWKLQENNLIFLSYNLDVYRQGLSVKFNMLLWMVSGDNNIPFALPSLFTVVSPTSLL